MTPYDAPAPSLSRSRERARVRARALRQAAPDAERSAALQTAGYRVLRFSDREALTERDGVLQTILSQLNAGHPHPNPLPPAGEGDEDKELFHG